MIQHAANAPSSYPEAPLIRAGGGYLAMMPQAATQERLAQAHQRVVLHNTDPIRNFQIKDRFHQYHPMRPDQKIEIDMVVDEIANLHDQSRTDRGYFLDGPNKGKPFPAHPVKVIGIPPVQSRPIEDREAELSRTAAALAAREAELIEREAKLNEAAGSK